MQLRRPSQTPQAAPQTPPKPSTYYSAVITSPSSSHSCIEPNAIHAFPNLNKLVVHTFPLPLAHDPVHHLPARSTCLSTGISTELAWSPPHLVRLDPRSTLHAFYHTSTKLLLTRIIFGLFPRCLCTHRTSTCSRHLSALGQIIATPRCKTNISQFLRLQSSS